MVSKVAVIALVAIVACPILIGYGMNLVDTTETDYKIDGNSVNVTNVLKNDVYYDYAHGDIYKMNTEYRLCGGSYPTTPIYNTITNQYTSLGLSKAVYSNQSWNNANQAVGVDYFYEQFDYDYAATNVQVQIYGYVYGTPPNETLYGTYSHFHSFHYDATDRHKTIFTRYTATNDFTINIIQDYIPTRIVLTTLTGTVDKVYVIGSSTTKYVDFAGGWYFTDTPLYKPNDIWPSVRLPDYTKEYLLTVNLDSITQSSYTMHIDLAPSVASFALIPTAYYPMELKKTTTGGVVTWTLSNENDPTQDPTELYYNPSGDNTYQFRISAEQLYDETDGKYYVNANVKATYVGKWPTMIGDANPYIVYDLDYLIDDPAMAFSSPLSLDDLSYFIISFKVDNRLRTPTMRVDDAYFRGFTYNVINDQTYDAAAFKQNPITTISDIQIYGDSIEFGGHLYVVKGGNITLGSHQIPVNDLQFSSTLVDGSYENKIGNTLVSTTASPSTIEFNGYWSMDVSTASLTEYTYTKTEWKAGSFGWDGLDHNFLIVGLITSVGAFIAIAIYAKTSNKSLWPALIVCGGAAMLFFAML